VAAESLFPDDRPYLFMGPWGGRFAAVKHQDGKLIAWVVTSPAYDRLTMTIWMDGRAPPPSHGLHTFAGFNTGQYEGNTLLVTTTQLKDVKLLSEGSIVNDPILYCMPAEVLAGFTDGYHSAIELPPREAEQLAFMKAHYNLPLDATLGGARTMYPEFARKLESEYKPPANYCKLYCLPDGHLLPYGPAHIQTR